MYIFLILLAYCSFVGVLVIGGYFILDLYEMWLRPKLRRWLEEERPSRFTFAMPRVEVPQPVVTPVVSTQEKDSQVSKWDLIDIPQVQE